MDTSTPLHVENGFSPLSSFLYNIGSGGVILEESE